MAIRHDDRIDAGDRTVRVEFRASATPSGEVVVWGRESAQGETIAPEDFQILQLCGRVAPTYEHAWNISQKTGWDPRLVFGRLLNLKRRGLLLSVANALASCLDGAGRPPESAIEWLAIPTYNRQKEVYRALESYGRHLARFGAKAKVFVAAGAEETSSSDEYMLKLSRCAGCFVSYAGRAEVDAYAARLCSDGGIPPSVVRFALLGDGFAGPAIGANRNVILLQSHGSLVLSVDDDTICRPASAPALARRQLYLQGEADPTEFWFFANRQLAEASVQPFDRGILAEHEAILGRKVSALVGNAELTVGVSAERICSHLLQAIAKDTGRVVLTLNGVVGDSGMHSADGLVLHRGYETRRRMDECAETFALALTSSEVIRQSANLTVCHGAPVMSTFLGYDNRILLPPFLPVYRNEDGLFGAMVEACVPGGFCGYLPFVLAHAPGATRSYSRLRWLTIRVADIFLALIGHCVSNTFGTTEARLRCLGQFLLSISSTPDREFMAFIRIRLTEMAVASLNRHVNLVSEWDNPPEFASVEMQRQIRCLHELVTMLARELVVVDLIEAGYSLADQPFVLKALVRSFGEVLSWWPDILEKMQSLRVRGYEVGPGFPPN